MGNIFHKIKKAIAMPYLIPLRLIPNKLIPDYFFLKCQYHSRIGKKLNLKNPVLFNEKIQWLKLHDRNPEHSNLIDKYEVRNFISNTIGSKYLVPSYGVWDTFDEIPFELLPDKFVLKCTHDSASMTIYEKSKLSTNNWETGKCIGEYALYQKPPYKYKTIRDFYNWRLSENHFWWSREWKYKSIKPRMIAEKFLVDESGNDLKDYKIHCFNGEPKIIEVHFDRFTEHKIRFYSIDWELLPLESKNPSPQNISFPKPESLEQMMHLAQVLSKSTIYVRVDLFYLGNQIYFSELTFTPAGGFKYFNPPEWNKTFGDWLKLPI
jgi:hypothetical protein